MKKLIMPQNLVSLVESALVILLFCIMFSGCRTKYIPLQVEKIRTEYENRYLRDSIYIHDSIYITQRGDTVLIEKWHTAYRDRIKLDTIVTHDTIPAPYPVEKPVHYRTGFDWFQIWLARIAALLLAAWFIKKRFF